MTDLVLATPIQLAMATADYEAGIERGIAITEDYMKQIGAAWDPIPGVDMPDPDEEGEDDRLG